MRFNDESLIKYLAAPTFDAIKPATIMNLSSKNSESTKKTISILNKNLKNKGIKIITLKNSPNRKHLFIYHHETLKKTLEDPRVQIFLKSKNYPNPSSLTNTIATLGKKFKYHSEFPHEIGIFLGYPFHDVLGFINNKAQNALCKKPWLVYNNEDNARKIEHAIKLSKQKAFNALASCEG